MTLTSFPTWPVDGPPPLRPVHGLLQAAEAPAAGVRIVVDTTEGPVDANSIARSDEGLAEGLYREADGSVWMRMPGAAASRVWTPENAGRERWLNGVAVWPYPPDVPFASDACSRSSKPFGTTVDVPEFAPLVVSEVISCTMAAVMRDGKPDEARWRSRAVETLTAVEGFAVAREFMSGTVLGSQPYLADSSATFPNGQVATKPNHALQVLEQAIALTGRLGIIHCSPMLATALLGGGFVISDSTGVIRTINGNVVIPDNGYVGVSKPAMGAAPGATQEWMYATGPVDMRRSEVFTMPGTLAEALDRGTGLGATNGTANFITYRAERYYVTDWDTVLQAAVLADRCSTDCAVSS